jgi:hypothetical protein
MPKLLRYVMAPSHFDLCGWVHRHPTPTVEPGDGPATEETAGTPRRDSGTEERHQLGQMIEGFAAVVAYGPVIYAGDRRGGSWKRCAARIQGPNVSKEAAPA